MACGILVPQTGIDPAPLALEVQSLNHWTTREVSKAVIFVVSFDSVSMKWLHGCILDKNLIMPDLHLKPSPGLPSA